jgi:4-deoxy-L-threo-5-hexosulose-uronate ketol-isomerase
VRHAVDPATAARMTSAELRAHFHIDDLFAPGRISLTYTHYDRMIIGGAVPLGAELRLGPIRPTGTAGFLDRRELIVFNVGGPGIVRADETVHRLDRQDMLYVGRGAAVAFASVDATDPARFYLLSAPAHTTHPTRLVRADGARRLDLGSREAANERTIFQYVHPDGVRTCQLVAGLTRLAPGSVWNTMPCHVHDRRMEVYLYLELPPTARAFHFLGDPRETRHVIVGDGEAVLSPPWSIHSGCGTGAYAFIWAMAGDNVDYTDVDPVTLEDLR